LVLSTLAFRPEKALSVAASFLTVEFLAGDRVEAATGDRE